MTPSPPPLPHLLQRGRPHSIPTQFLRLYSRYGGHRRPSAAKLAAGTGRVQVLPSLWRPVAFALGITGSAFLIAASSTNAESNQQLERFKQRPGFSGAFLDSIRGVHLQGATSYNLARLRLLHLRDTLARRVKQFAIHGRTSWNRLLVMSAEKWLSMSEAERTCLGLIAVQGLIFGLWQIPRLAPFMHRHFLTDPLSTRQHTAITSIFSHNSLPHFAFNSIAFLSIGASAHACFFESEAASDAPTATSRFEFLAFFLAGGLAGNLASTLHTRLVKIPRLLRSGQATNLAAAGVLPSLGASAAIWSCLSVSALAFPSASLSIIFLPFIKLPIGAGVAMAAAVDVLGLIRGWRFFDHAAHLGGAAFGLLYYNYGASLFNSVRSELPSKPQDHR